MASFLLVHGAWHGAWCWARLVPLLAARGHRVAAIDLPAHGDDTTPRWRVSLGRYAAAVVSAARAQPAPPIVVGHSMGGLVVSQAAIEARNAFGALVYLCAFAPRDGESLLALARGDRGSLVPAALRRGLVATRIRSERAAAAFYHRCAPAVASAAIARLCPNPALPFFQPVRGDAGSLGIPRSYVACSDDRAITIELQRAMVARQRFDRVSVLDSDHSPFLSAPGELATVLDELARPAGPGTPAVPP